MNTLSFDSMDLDFLECVPDEEGFVIRHKETKWHYIPVAPDEATAWQDLNRRWTAIAAGLAEAVGVAGTASLDLRSDPSGLKRRESLKNMV